jgi:hypothetical protein
MLHKYKQYLKEIMIPIIIPSDETINKVNRFVKHNPKKTATAAAITAGALGYGIYKGNQKQKENWDKYGCSREYYQDGYDRCMNYLRKKKLQNKG